ncbi:Motile sperm domain-containing protein 1 [Desmophyllum pertusum]|uniref:Motile sperm domain-containing protein 1 n=1 Tax=Desmophyllum pertusum TaxID=174260 RepID=A0A9X0D1E5_9CNID|nr:Motile sperm domain-containing protein 1 [Desmophyllum pertusum]
MTFVTWPAGKNKNIYMHKNEQYNDILSNILSDIFVCDRFSSIFVSGIQISLYIFGWKSNQKEREEPICMRSLQPSHFTDGSLPVFVFPQTLTFYADEQSTHKQVLTVYNPYEFALRFKVLSTAPSRYIVVDSDGVIKPRCCIDIVIRHTDIQPAITQQDKFRLHIFEHGLQKVIGKKEIMAVLQPSRTEQQQKPKEEGRSLRRSQRTRNSSVTLEHFTDSGHGQQGPSLWVIIMAVACIIALVLPMEGDKHSDLPHYLLLSVNQKLLAAFILGLIVMAILKA